MATKTTGSLTVKSTSTIATALDYSADFTTKFTYTESTGAGANAFTIHSDTTAVALSLKGTSDDVLIIDGYSGDYTAKLSGTKLTLDNNNQIITVALAAKSIVKLKFLDGSKDVNLTEKTLGGDSLITKTGVLHINGVSSHESTSVTTAVKAALTDVNKKNYATVDAAIISDNTLVISKALTDKSGKSYATVDAAITSNDAAITTQALTDTSVTPNVSYPNLNAAIISDNNTIISQALTGTNFSTIASLISAYNKFANQSLTSFNIEALTPATMLPASTVSVSEGGKAYFKISLTNRVATGDYSVKTMLTGTLATPDSDFVNSLTLDDASIAAGIKFNPITGILTIPASSQSISAILSTSIKNDMVSPEAGEKINLAISDAQGASVAPLGTTNIASVTILDVQPPTFSVTANTGPVLEGAPTTYTVSLANHAVSNYSVNVKLTGTNAGQGLDFSALTLDPTTPATIKFDSTTGILTIPAAAATTSVKFNTTINTDNRVETGQSVTLALSQDTTNSANANTVITPATSSTTTIITDITPAFSVTAESSSVDKGKPASFTVSLVNATTGDYKVNLAATTLNSSFLNTLALESTNSNAGVTFDGSVLTIPAATITAANTAKLPIKAVLTSLTSPIDNTSISLALLNPTGTNVATAKVVSKPITINNVSDTLLTSAIDNPTLPANTNTLIIGDQLTINSNANGTDKVVDDSSDDFDIINIKTNDDIPKTMVITKVETVNLTATDTISVDMTAIAGVKTFNIVDSTASVTLTLIPDATTVLGLRGSQINNLTATYKTLTGKTDSLNVNLDSATDAIINVGIGFEFATLNVLNTSSLKLFDAGAGVTTLTISGNTPLTVGNNALKYIEDLELNNNNVIKFGTIGDPTSATTITNYPFLTTFKALTNTGGITTGLIQGATGGFTMQLGEGTDSISIKDNTAFPINTNDIRLGAGNDSLTFTKGSSGNTYISGEDNNDTISVNGAGSSTSIDTIDGGNGDDRITIGVGGKFFINGGAGADFITDGAGSNVIDGGADADTITGGAGNDTITGGTGNDTISVDSGTDTITDFTIGSDKLTISLGAIAYVYASGVANYSNDVTNSGILYIDRSQTYAGIPVTTAENITGSSGADEIKGGAGNDTITGGLGNDTINAVSGTDTITDFKIDEDILEIIDGAIAYVYASGTTDFSTVTNSGTGKLYIDGSKNFLGVNVTGAENITGSSGADSIIGGSGDDTITLGSGKDTVTAALGNDTITDFSYIDDKLIISNGASATIYTSGTADFSTSVTNSGTGTLIIDGRRNHLGVMVTNAENTTGSTGADEIYGGSGNDTITGGLGNDTIDGKEGSDNIIVNSGKDTINNYFPSSDTLTINAGATAHVYTSGSNSYALTNNGSLYVTNNGTLYIDGIAAVGTQTITGSTGRDSIVGGAYNDTITGGNGDDTISGGSGRNTINVDKGTDTITDFLLSYDRLEVSEDATAHLYAFTNTLGGKVDYSNISNLGTLYIDGSTTYAGTLITGAAGITGSNGMDFIVGGIGNDTIYGGLGNDTITGGAGNDLIKVDSNSTDIITDFNPSSDTLVIFPGATARVYASGTVSYMTSVTNDGKLYIDGSTTYTGTAITAAASITGTNKADSIVGGSGADILTGGAGIDTLTGGAGADTFVFGTDGSIYSPNSPNTAQDSITDFTSGSDLIRFAGTFEPARGTITGGEVDSYGFAKFTPDVSYSDKVSALKASSITKTVQTVSLFVDDTDTYVFFSGTPADTTDDQVIKLTGVSGRFFDEITVNGTDITIS